MKQSKKQSKTSIKDLESSSLNIKIISRDELNRKLKRTEKVKLQNIKSNDDIIYDNIDHGVTFPVYTSSVSPNEIYEGLQVLSVYCKTPVKIKKIMQMKNGIEVKVDDFKYQYLRLNQIKLIEK
jgi:hypothetical protein